MGWTREQEVKLMRLRRCGLLCSQIAKALGRTEDSVRSHLHRLGVKRGEFDLEKLVKEALR